MTERFVNIEVTWAEQRSFADPYVLITNHDIKGGDTFKSC